MAQSKSGTLRRLRDRAPNGSAARQGPGRASGPAGKKRMERGSRGEPLVEVRPSGIHGRGLFARRSFRRGDCIGVMRGTVIRAKFSPETSHVGPNWVGLGWGEWIILERGNPVRFSNHACQPNVIVGRGRRLIALRPIAAGDEILLDYSTTEVDPYWRFSCRCGSAACRGAIGPFQTLSAELRRRYRSWLTGRFLRAAKRAASSEL